MRFAVVLLLLASGCTREAPQMFPDAFTFVGVPIGIRSEVRQTIDGRVQSMIIKVVEVKKGRCDDQTMFFDFEEGTAPPLKMGKRYLFVANWGHDGMHYSEVKEEPIQLPVPMSGLRPAMAHR